MALKFGLEMLVTNVGIDFEWIVILILLVGSIIIAAKHFQISMIVLLVSMAGVFVWFYQVGYNWVLPLVLMFMALIVLSLSLYSTSATSSTGGYT